MQKVQITLHVPKFAMEPPFTPFDGTIAGMLFGGRVVENDEIKLPFAQANDVPLASLPIIGSSFRHFALALRSFESHVVTNGRLQGLRDDDLSHSSVFSNKSPSHHRGSKATVHFPESGFITYYATCDVAIIRRTLMENPAIGIWKAKGYGEIIPRGDDFIDSVKVIESDLPIGIVDPEGNLIRPVPLFVAERLGIPSEAYFKVDWRHAPPYNPRVAASLGYETSVVAVPRFAYEEGRYVN